MSRDGRCWHRQQFRIRNRQVIRRESRWFLMDRATERNRSGSHRNVPHTPPIGIAETAGVQRHQITPSPSIPGYRYIGIPAALGQIVGGCSAFIATVGRARSTCGQINGHGHAMPPARV